MREATPVAVVSLCYTKYLGIFDGEGGVLFFFFRIF